jgi:endonuclease III
LASTEEKQRTRKIIAKLRKAYPDAHCSLNHANAFELLIATILSAQCTDERVNIVTADLFRKYRSCEDYVNVAPAELERDIHSTGFFRNKTKSIQGACKKMLEEHDGQVPNDIEKLLALPGVARKTANVVLGTAFGMAKSKTPIQITNAMAVPSDGLSIELRTKELPTKTVCAVKSVARNIFISATASMGNIFLGMEDYELAIRHVIGRWLEQGRSVPGALRYLNAFVETSVPTILIVLVSREINPVYVLQSASSLLYAVFIVLSTLRLDFRLSVFTGLVAAVEYVALSFAYLSGGSGAAAGTPFGALPFYVAKGAMLLLAGLAAGFVAHQLKRRVGNAYRALQERERVLSAFGQQVSPAIVDHLLNAGAEQKRIYQAWLGEVESP